MFSDSKLTHDTDLSTLTDIINSKRIYSGQNLGKYASEQKNNYKKRVAAASNLSEDGGPLLSRYDYNDYRISSDYERKVNAMDPTSRSKIIKNLATENFLKTSSQLLHNLSDRKFVRATFPDSSDVYSPGDMDKVHSLWTPKNKFETFLTLPKRRLLNNLGKKSLGVGEDKTKGMALMKPLPAPQEVIRDDSGILRPIPRQAFNVIPPPSNIKPTPVYDPIEFPEDVPYINPLNIPSDTDSAFRRFDGDLRVDDVNRDFQFPAPPPPLSPSLDFPSVPSHEPRYPTPPPEYESEEDINARLEDKNHKRILRKLRTAPKPPTGSPEISEAEDEEEDEDPFLDALGEQDKEEKMSWDEAESLVDTSSSNNFVQDVNDVLKMVAQLTSVVDEKLSTPFKTTLLSTQIQNFILYLVDSRPDVLIENRLDRNYSQIYTFDKDGSLRETNESILYLIYNMLDLTKRVIKPLDELKGQVILEDYDRTFSSYYNGIANMNMSDYFEADYLPHLKLLVQQFNDSRDMSHFQPMLFRSYKDPSPEAFRENRKMTAPLVFFMDELNSFNLQVDDNLRLRVGVDTNPNLINLIELVKDTYDENLYVARFLYDFFFKRIFKETEEGKGNDGMGSRISYRGSLMDSIKDFKIGDMPARRVIEQITRDYDRSKVHNILPHEDIMNIADCFIDAFYKQLICIPFGVQVPVELIKIIDDYKYLYDSFKSQWENSYNNMSLANKTMARYFALNFLFVFYTYGVSVMNGDMITEDFYDQRKETLNNMSLSNYITAVLDNMNKSIEGFDLDREQSFFYSLNEFRTTLGNMYMDKVLIKKRSPSPVTITEDYKPYVTIDEARENEREERLAREQRRLDDLKQEEYEKEVEDRENEAIRRREIAREEARALANAEFEAQRQLYDEAVENERVRIERLNAERAEIVKQSVEDQIKSHEEQEREWRSVNENLNVLERTQDIRDEEQAEQNLDWDSFANLSENEEGLDAALDALDGEKGIDPLYGIEAIAQSDAPTKQSKGRKLVYRWGDMNQPLLDGVNIKRRTGKRKSEKPLKNLHLKKTFRKDDSESEDKDNLSDIDDLDPDMRHLTDLSSGEENEIVKRRQPISHTRKKVKHRFTKSGSKRRADIAADEKYRRKMQTTLKGRVVRRFMPIRELPSQPSFVRDEEEIAKRFVSDVSGEGSVSSASEDDYDVNPALRQLKSQMTNYRAELLTDDEDGDDNMSSDADEW